MEKSGFFNSSGGDRIYDATDFAAYFGSLVSNGIFYRTADNLKIVMATGMNVTAQAGAAFINGYHYANTAPMALVIATADGVYPRVDRVVVRWSNIERKIQLVVKTGVAADIPSAPELARTSDIYELGIADIAVPQGAVSITSDYITDTRLNSSLCGLVNSLVSAVYE